MPPAPSSPHTPSSHRRLRRVAAAGAALLALVLPTGCGGGSGAGKGTTGGGVAVPLTYLPAGSEDGRLGEPRLQAAVRIGSKQLNLLVDTGSTGLKVLASAVGDGNATPTGATGSSAYLSGLQISGREAQATITLGSATAQDQTVMLVDTLGCTDEVPDCEAAHGKTPEEFGGVFDGILGIGMAERAQGVRGCCANPMLGLTNNGSFVLHFDERKPELVLNPDQKTLGRFTTVDLKQSATPAAWNPAPMQACLTVTTVLGTRCAPVVFDTGTPTLALEAPRIAGPAPGALIDKGIVDTYGQEVTLDVPSAKWKWSYRMPQPDAQAQQQLNALTTPLLSYGAQQQSVILAGLPAFTQVDVLYDLRGGRIGLAPR